MTVPMRILVVDDSPVDRIVVKHVLKRAFPGVELAEAQDGVEALTLLKADDAFDLILLDLNMPRMGGLEFLQTWSKRKGTTKPLVVILTSSGQDADREAASSFAVVDDFLVKPFTGADASRLRKYAAAALSGVEQAFPSP